MSSGGPKDILEMLEGKGSAPKPGPAASGFIMPAPRINRAAPKSKMMPPAVALGKRAGPSSSTTGLSSTKTVTVTKIVAGGDGAGGGSSGGSAAPAAPTTAGVVMDDSEEVDPYVPTRPND